VWQKLAHETKHMQHLYGEQETELTVLL